ncbi:hypothetical protein DLAC_01148 [Tieghemostelium lacteum]|uniref:NADAR domain-containing protein n=1 Tax=Tieghemostelium lacteum TaxID=361077 RepID=A0A152A7X1_TIELA|nr:hypothetical protein DLAC_01148 [Tieghemostelium lacteum]|eukprot:KYR02316.1 hypothetical protein DLAC_01148 [Tieghemostelium lacteum]
MEDNTINFYRGNEYPYGCFSNFSRHVVHLAGHAWPTSEHYFQAMKFEGTPHYFDVLKAKTPGDSAKIGRDRSRPLRKDWEEIKDRIMFDVVLAKFTQHKDLKEILLGTGDKTLVEHTANDSYWGDGGDGTGRNQLGITLMNVRRAIRELVLLDKKDENNNNINNNNNIVQ